MVSIRLPVRHLLAGLLTIPGERALRDFDPHVGGGVDLDRLSAADFAGKHRSYPIENQSDVDDALQSIGSAGDDNYAHDELHRRILAIAKRKGLKTPIEAAEDSDDDAGSEPDGDADDDTNTSHIQPRTRRRLPADGQRRVASDHGGRVTLPPDLTRTKVRNATLAAHELHDPYGLDLDVDWEKIDMPDVHYEYQSSDPARVCMACRFYDPDHDGDPGCAIVAGNIRPLGVCDHFQTPFPMAMPATTDDDDDEDSESELNDGAVTPMLHELNLTEPFAWGVELGEGKPIQIMRTGRFKHPDYGPFAITPVDMAEIVQNFNAGVRGQDIPIDIDHGGPSGDRHAVGWFKSLSIVDGDKLFAVPDWNSEGETLVGDGKYRYFSPHFGPWENTETGQQHRLVLLSGAITNFPFLKQMQPLSLNEFAAGQKGTGAMTEEEMRQAIAAAEARATAAEQAATVATEAKALAEKTVTATELSLAERAEAAEKALSEQRQMLEQIKHDNLVRELTDTIRGHGNPNRRWIGDESEQLSFMLTLAETFGKDSSQLKHYVDEHEATAARLRAAGAFSERGSSRVGDPATARVQIEAKLTEAAPRVTGKERAKSLMDVLLADPRLYNQYDQETVIRVDAEGRN